MDALAWHPNGHYLATGSNDRTARLWDVASGVCVRLLTSQASPLTSLAFAPGGDMLAAGCEDGGIAVYELTTGRRLELLRGHEGAVWALSFSHGEGSVLASGGADCSVRLWSALAQEESLLALAQEEEEAAAAAAAGVKPAGDEEGGGDGAPAAAAVGPAAGAEQQGAQAGKQQAQPWQLLRTYRTRATPVAAAGFTPRNLLLAGGALTLRAPAPAAVGQARR